MGLKGKISIDADSGPPRYVLWCCCGICHEVITFIQIGCGHTVHNSLQGFKSASFVFSLLIENFRTHFGISILFDFWKVWGYRLQEKCKINLANYVNTQSEWGYIWSIFILSIWKNVSWKNQKQVRKDCNPLWNTI